MSAVIHEPFAERFRDPDSPYLSPVKVSETFGLRVQELAEGAHVHRNTPTARPHAAQLQDTCRTWSGFWLWHRT